MRDLGIRGATRGKPKQTTTPVAASESPRDLLDRKFGAVAPNRLWVADLTYVRTKTGFVYVRIVGCKASRSLTANIALDALEQAIWDRKRDNGDLTGLIHHSDKGSQYLAIAYTNRLARNGVIAPVGSRGDSYDNALAETIIGLYKTELINNKRPWSGLKDLELATLEYIDWYNHQRIYDTLRNTTPAEHETNHHTQTTTKTTKQKHHQTTR